jgi:uncharacterized membrane protein YeiH
MIYVLDLFGTAVFAISGALAAGRKRMDLFGVCVLALVTAVGGGTLRDVLLGVRPIFWVSDQTYLYVSLAAAIVTFAGARRQLVPARLLLVADALGLAVFTVIGAKKALLLGHTWLIATVMGMMTGVVGGMIRDLLRGEIPLILRAEIYATASLCGAVGFVVLYDSFDLPFAATPVSIGITLLLRIAALKWRLSLPLFDLPEDETERPDRDSSS